MHASVVGKANIHLRMGRLCALDARRASFPWPQEPQFVRIVLQANIHLRLGRLSALRARRANIRMKKVKARARIFIQNPVLSEPRKEVRMDLFVNHAAKENIQSTRTRKIALSVLQASSQAKKMRTMKAHA